MRHRRLPFYAILIVLTMNCAADVTMEDEAPSTELDDEGRGYSDKLVNGWSAPFTASSIRAIDIANDGSDRVFTWAPSNRAHKGTSTQLSQSSAQMSWGTTPGEGNLKAVAVAKNTQHVFYFFNGTGAGWRSEGTSDCADCFTGVLPLQPNPPDSSLTADKLKEVAISANTGRVYYYWVDNTINPTILSRTIGDSRNPTRYSQKTAVNHPGGSIHNLRGVAFNASDTTYAWYGSDNDTFGTVRTGDSLNL